MDLDKIFDKNINTQEVEFWNCPDCGTWLKAVKVDGRWFIYDEEGSPKWEASPLNIRPDWSDIECICQEKE